MISFWGKRIPAETVHFLCISAAVYVKRCFGAHSDLGLFFKVPFRSDVNIFPQGFGGVGEKGEKGVPGLPGGRVGNLTESLNACFQTSFIKWTYH